jgi:hypothetical protein
MNRERFLVVHGESPKKWAERFGLTREEFPCAACGKVLPLNIPFAHGKYRGLMAPVCQCGYTRTPYSLVVDPKYGDLFSHA